MVILYWKHPRLLLVKGSTLKVTGRPVVIISTPRSGSSWIGSIVGSADNARYLREPITTNYMISGKERVSFFEPEKCNDWPNYCRYADDAFRAKLKFSNSVIFYPYQWLDKITKRITVIKEINPLVLSTFQQKFNPKILYIIRHPFTVAKSFNAVGWSGGNQFLRRFSENNLSLIIQNQPDLYQKCFWFQFGYLMGIIESKVLSQLKSYDSLLTVRYEEICESPLDEFKKIFAFADLDFSDQVILNIRDSLGGEQTIAVGDFSLVREKDLVGKVEVTEHEQKRYEELMIAYKLGLNSDLEFVDTK
jgi:hypothetical protein